MTTMMTEHDPDVPAPETETQRVMRLDPGAFAPPTMQMDPQYTDAGLSDDEKAACTPVPVGFRILCAVPQAKDTFDGSMILKAEVVKRNEEFGTTMLYVVELGPEAYSDKVRFPNGPYCKPGDYVLVRTYTGTRVVVSGREYRLINDDQVEAVVADPRGIMRVGA